MDVYRVFNDSSLVYFDGRTTFFVNANDRSRIFGISERKYRLYFFLYN